jgi:hypothetical protein
MIITRGSGQLNQESQCFATYVEIHIRGSSAQPWIVHHGTYEPGPRPV